MSGFQSESSFAPNVSKWNTQLFLLEKKCRVNSPVNLPCSGVGRSTVASECTPDCIALSSVKI